MNIQSTFIIFIKELRDILRDRRTIISMILLPIVIFPLFIVGPQLFMKKQREKIEEKVSKVVWIAPAEADYMLDKVAAIPGIKISDLTTDSVIAVELIKEKQIEALVIVPENFQSALDAALNGNAEVIISQIGIYTNKTRTLGRIAGDKISEALQAFRTELVEELLNERGMPTQLVKPFWIIEENIASAKEMSRFIVGMILPYILILMAMIGAMYPAIDLTAGEKERGTLETLLVSGVSRIDIVIGKFLTVFTASLVTATLSVISMAATGLIVLKTNVEISNHIQFDMGLQEVFLMIITMIPLAAIFSSLLMTVSLFAKSYREAQSYVSPLMMLVIVPAMASIMPDTEASREMALIPVLNVSMMLKDSLAGTIDPTVASITMAVNLILAVFCLFLVLRMFKRESVLFRI